MGYYTQSRSAFPVTLELYEVEALIDWHRAEEFNAADDGDYSAAGCSKTRREALEEMLKSRREAMKTEALEITKKNLAVTNGDRNNG